MVKFDVSNQVTKKKSFFPVLFEKKKSIREFICIYKKRDVHEILRYSTVMSSGLSMHTAVPPLAGLTLYLTVFLTL